MEKQEVPMVRNERTPTHMCLRQFAPTFRSNRRFWTPTTVTRSRWVGLGLP